MGFKTSHSSAFQRDKIRFEGRKVIQDRMRSTKIIYDSTKVPQFNSAKPSTQSQPQIIELPPPPSLAKLNSDSSIIGQITYKKPSTTETTINELEKDLSATSFSTSTDPMKPIEQQVIEIYTSEINKLQVRESFKSYLRRTLEMIVNSDGSLKLHLLDIRRQLRKRQTNQIEPQIHNSQFIALIDKLYLLAVDKQISLSLGSYEPASNSSSRGSHNIEEILVNSRASGFLSGSSSPSIARILHMNAVQRLAQAYRYRLNNTARRNRDDQIVESSIDRVNEEDDDDQQEYMGLLTGSLVRQSRLFLNRRVQNRRMSLDNGDAGGEDEEAEELQQLDDDDDDNDDHDDDYDEEEEDESINRMDNHSFLELLRMRMGSLIDQRRPTTTRLHQDSLSPQMPRTPAESRPTQMGIFRIAFNQQDLGQSNRSSSNNANVDRDTTSEPSSNIS